MSDKTVDSHYLTMMLTGLTIFVSIHVSDRVMWNESWLHATLMIISSALMLFPVIRLQQNRTVARSASFSFLHSLFQGKKMKMLVSLAAVSVVALSLICANSDIHSQEFTGTNPVHISQ